MSKTFLILIHNLSKNILVIRKTILEIGKAFIIFFLNLRKKILTIRNDIF